MALTVSVITAAFNRAATVEHALQSVHSQKGAKVQHVVIDGASNDGTLQVIERHRDQIDVLVSEKDHGIYDALNKGLAKATGDVVGVLHSDDFFADEHVLERISGAFSDSRVQAVYGDLDYVSSDTTRLIRRWRSGDYSAHRLAQGWMPPHPTLYVRRGVYERWGGFDTHFKIAADYELMLRLFTDAAIKPAYIPQVLVKMRWGGESNRSLSRIIRKSREDYAALRRHKVGGIWTLCQKNLRKVSQFF